MPPRATSALASTSMTHARRLRQTRWDRNNPRSLLWSVSAAAPSGKTYRCCRIGKIGGLVAPPLSATRPTTGGVAHGVQGPQAIPVAELRVLRPGSGCGLWHLVLLSALLVEGPGSRQQDAPFGAGRKAEKGRHGTGGEAA